MNVHDTTLRMPYTLKTIRVGSLLKLVARRQVDLVGDPEANSHKAVCKVGPPRRLTLGEIADEGVLW